MKLKLALMIKLCLGLAVVLVLAVLAGLSLGKPALANAPGALSAATIPVTTTIQAAIDAAQAGDIVSIPAGAYTESLTIDKSLTLTGAGSGATIVHAIAGQRVISVTDVDVRLMNLKVTGGQSDGGGGIWANNANVQILACWIVDNAAGYGGGVFQGGDGSVELTDSRVEANDSVNHGGGIYANGDLALTRTVVISNTAGGHGGGAVSAAGNVSIYDSMFERNAAGIDGGGLNGNNNITLRRTTFISNTAASGGGFSQWNADRQVDVIESIFVHNTAGNGSALRVRAGLNAVNALFAANAGSGGALYLTGLSGEQMLRHVTIASPDVDGGTAIYIENGAVAMINTIVASYTTGIEQVTGTLNYDYNLFFGNGSAVACDWTCNAGGSNVYDSDPLFANPIAADYHLRAGSGAINAGAELGVTSDLDGLPRPDPGAAPDIGAYESHSAGIAGRVSSVSDGSPLADVEVTLYSDRTGTTVDYVSTDGTGQYSFADIDPGAYYLEFDPGYGSEFAGEFYNNQPDLTNADPVAVIAGQMTTVDAALDTYGMITGRVTASDNGAPLLDVTVEVYTSTAPDSYYVTSAQTNASGVYTLSDLDPGTYYLHFDPPIGDYAGEYYDNQPSLAFADPVNVALNTAQTIDAALALAGRVVGVVTAADTHLPLADVHVHLWTLDKCGLCVQSVDTMVTDASGRYTVTGLLAGVVYAEFEPIENGNAAFYLSEYYHDQTSSCGDPITVTLGATQQVDEDLDRGAVITGRVTAADGGAGLPAVELTLDGIPIEVQTNASGYYTITAVRTGDHTLFFAPNKNGASAAYAWQYYDTRNRSSQADPLHVTAPEVKTVNQTLSRGGWITGKVTASDTGNELADYFIAVYDEDHTYIFDSYGNTDASGVYTTGILPAGAYFIEFQDMHYSPEYLDEYYNGKFSLLTDVKDLTDDDLVNVTGGTATTINAALTRGGHISGRVTAADTGLPLENMLTRIYRAGDGEQLYSVDGGITDATGVYTTGALPSGNYFLKFVTFLSVEESLFPYVSEQFYHTVGGMAEATQLTVTAPDVTTADDVIQMGGHISGQVFTADTGEPSPYVRVYVVSSTDTDAPSIAYTTTAVNGTYFTQGLWPGDYKVNFRKAMDCGEASQFYYLKPSWATADLVHVTAPNVTPNITGVIGLGGGDWTQPVSAPVTPGSGGTLIYIGRHGTVYTIVVPPGAVTEDLDLVFTPVLAPTQLPLGRMGYTGEVFDLDLYRNGQLVSGVSFQEAISVTIHYVNADLVGRNEDTFKLYRWLAPWEMVGAQNGENQSLDAAANLLTAHLMNLSRFSGQAALTASLSHRVYLPIVLRHSP